MRRVIPYRFDHPEPLCPSFTEQYSVTRSEILRPLNEPERNSRTVSGPDEGAVDVNDSASLRYWTNVQHGLILGLDSGRVAQY